MQVLKGLFSKILVIGDIHAPYHHPDTYAFLTHLRDRYEIDSLNNPRHLVISIGDEADGHGWSYHDKDPELYSPGEEFRQARTFFQHLHAALPRMKIIESNHGSLHLRKQKSMGMPKGFFRNYNEAWDVGPGWEWVYDLCVEMSNGVHCYFHHGRTSQVLKLSQSMGMCAVQGHYHEKMGAQYWRTPAGTFWAAQTGCLVDEKSLAMAYGKNNLKKPVLGSLVIINGYPISVPMILNQDGRWIGRIV